MATVSIDLIIHMAGSSSTLSRMFQIIPETLLNESSRFYQLLNVEQCIDFVALFF